MRFTKALQPNDLRSVAPRLGPQNPKILERQSVLSGDPDQRTFKMTVPSEDSSTAIRYDGTDRFGRQGMTDMMRGGCWLGVVLVGITSGRAVAQSAEVARECAARIVIDKVEALLPPHVGACVLAIDDGEVVFRQGFGLADVEAGTPCSPATNFRMASVSKQFTAAAVMRLVEQGRVQLNDTLGQFFPGFPEYGRKIQVRHLLTHTSGLPAYEGLVPDGTTLQLNDLDVLQLLLDTDKPKFAAGEKFEYSNSAFVLLGLIVEQASGQPFHEFVREEILRPSGMHESLIYQRGLNEVPQRAFGHELQDGKWARADQSVTSATRGDGCVYTSLEDYLKWLSAHANRKLLSAKSHDAMFSPQAKTTRGESSYGYGWFIDEYRSEPRIQHNGDSRGFRLCVQTFPERRAAVVLQFNGNVEEEMMKVGERMADILIFDRKTK
jgi:CubicO group peptidase (beta-lactamase class C family)